MLSDHQSVQLHQPIITPKTTPRKNKQDISVQRAENKEKVVRCPKVTDKLK